jgi:tripartite-type tricarboxylate transporter receptor subunit TctC
VGKGQGEGAVYGAAPGAGSSSHFVGIAMAQSTGVPFKPVHYKDSGVGIIDLAAGRLPMLITGTSPVAVQHKAGKIKMVAVSGEKRSPLAPEVPTFKEQGFDVVIENSAALYGPRSCRATWSSGCTRADADAVVRAVLEKMAGRAWRRSP